MPTAVVVPSHQLGRVHRLARFFFMHLGTLAVLITYFVLCGRAQWTAAGVRSALIVTLVVQTLYMILARSAGELKHFDHALWITFALGTAAAYGGMESVFALFQRYSPAIMFAALGMAASISLLVGEPFTYYFARRQTPRWQQETATFAIVTRILAGYWVAVFFVAAGLCAWAPTDPWYTIVWPNLIIAAVGLPAAFWLPLLYLRLFPAPAPERLDALIMGMPFVFDRKAAGDSRAVIQFHVSGAERGDYYLEITRGRCRSFDGVAATANLTVVTPDSVWRRIARGELDGGAALADGLYRVEGDFPLLTKMQQWFPTAREPG